MAGISAAFIVLLFGVAVGFILHREDRRRRQVAEYLDSYRDSKAQSMLRGLPGREREQLEQIGGRLMECEAALQRERMLREEYEEYVEAWVHEVKVPLSLMALLLDNRREEMSLTVYRRMIYAQNQISEYVTQILYYARLKASHRDEYFERVSLIECCGEIAEKYQTVFEEENIHVSVDVDDCCVVTDRKGFLFILEQAFSNACKYQDGEKKERWLRVAGGMEEDRIVLYVQDNGIGVKEEDIPFLFERGFTGNTDERKRKATGIGLYLAKQMADNLKIEISAESKYGEGFALCLEFPVVDA